MNRTVSISLQLFAGDAAAPAAETTGAAPAAAEPSEAAPADAETDAAFEALIKGEYAGAFGRRVQKIIDRRFKQSKADEGAARALASLTEALSGAYPEFGGKSPEEIADALRAKTQEAPASQDETDALLEAAALRLEVGERRRRASEVLKGWEAEAETLKALYPGFELKTALRETGDFPKLLKAGLSLRRAYEAAHLEEILGEAMRYASRRASQRAAEALRAQRARPQENPVAARAATSAATDVNSLTGNDIIRILGEVSRGAKITFK